MRSMRVRLRIEAAHMVRSKWPLAAAAIWLIASGIAIELGAREMERTRGRIESAKQRVEEQETHLRSISVPDSELGYALYSVRFPTWSEPGGWAGFARGASGDHEPVVEIRLLGLIPQIFDVPLRSPLERLAGAYDLAFVLVFLLPLLVLAVAHDLLSRDRDLGMEPLVGLLPRSAAVRMRDRIVVVGILCALPLLFALVWASTRADSFDASVMATWALGALVYLGFWLLVAVAIARLGLGSSTNAVLAVGVWAVLVVLAPAALHATLTAALPIRSSAELVLDQRRVVNDAWDRPRLAAMDAFWERNPVYRDWEVPADQFSWSWYFAMHENGDAAVADARTALEARQSERLLWQGRAEWLLPSVALQAALERASGTSPAHQLEYAASVRAHHAALKAFFLPHVARDATLADVRLRDAPQHAFAPEPRTGVPLPLALPCAALLIVLAVRFRKSPVPAMPRLFVEAQ